MGQTARFHETLRWLAMIDELALHTNAQQAHTACGINA